MDILAHACVRHLPMTVLAGIVLWCGHGSYYRLDCGLGTFGFAGTPLGI